METAAVALTEAQERWPLWPVQNVDVKPKFPLNRMVLGPYIAKSATKSTGLQGRLAGTRRIWFYQFIDL